MDEIPLQTAVEASRTYKSRFYRLSAEETALVEPGKEGDQLVTVFPSGEAAWGRLARRARQGNPDLRELVHRWRRVRGVAVMRTTRKMEFTAVRWKVDWSLLPLGLVLTTVDK